MLSKIATVQKAISWIVARSEEVFGTICILAVSLIIFTQIIFREVGAPLAWMEETAGYVFVTFVFVMAASTARQRGHLVVEVLPLIIRKKLLVDIINLSLQLICLILTGVFAFLSYDYMMYAWGTPGYATASRFHLGWPKSFLFVGAVLLAGHYLAIVIKDAAKLKRERPRSKEVAWKQD